MCELYCEFTLENIKFTSISLRSEHKSRDLAGVCLKCTPSVQTDCVQSLGVDPKCKKNPLMEKSPVSKALPQNVQSMRLDNVVVHKL